MSSAFDKKTEKINRREERAEKERKEKRKIRIISVTVIIVFALLVAGALFINSKYVRRTLTAYTIGGVNFSAAEFDYFYNNAYKEYENYFTSNFGDYASSYLPSSELPHSSQIYDAETGMTWADFFTDYTTDQMSEMVQYYNAAKASGYVMPEDARSAIDTEIDTYRTYAEMYGYPTLESFLQAVLGSNMNEKCLRKILEFVNMSISYSNNVRESYTYDDAEISGYYSEKKDEFDSFTYRYFLVQSVTDEDADHDHDDDEEEDEEDAGLALAREAAELIASGIQSEEDFITEARQYNADDYSDPDSTLKVYPGSWLGTTYGPWLQEEGRQYGDVTTIDSTTGTYIVFFIDRDPNEYQLASMRQILIMRDEINAEEYIEGADDPAYLEAWDEADRTAGEMADEMLQQFVEGGATEEKLLELMTQYSMDSTEGGYYDLISKNAANNKMVPEIEEWLFAPGRQVGDYQLVRTEAYGYHLVYFMGYGDRYCDYLATDGMRTTDYNAWKESLPEVESAKKWAFVFTSH